MFLQQYRVQEDYSILADAKKVLENRHAVWTSYHDFCLYVAKWTTSPLVDTENKPALNIESIRQAVEDCTVKVFQLRKQNKVRCVLPAFSSMQP
jgi:hypothetical protein